MRIVTALLLALMLMLAGCSSGGTGSVFVDATGGVTIVVTSGAGVGIAGATVRLGDRAAVSNSDGICTFDGVPVGATTVQVTKPGFAPVDTTVSVEKDAEINGNLSLVQLSSEAEYDVIVVGAGTSGVSAVIQAARMGVKVALVEETDWIGGQMTAAAVTSLDEGFPRTRTGIFQEFIERVGEHYRLRGKATGTAYFDPTVIAFEPAVGQRILYKMIHGVAGSAEKSSRIDLYLRSRVESVIKTGNAVSGVILEDGSHLKGKVVVDATEYGDIIPLAGVRYRAGNSSSDNLDSDACLNPITWTAVVRKHLNGLDPRFLMMTSPPGYDGIREHFRSSVTNDGNFRSKAPVSFFYHNAWRGMPDSLSSVNYDASPGNEQKITKTGVNWFNDYPVTVQYLEDRAYRQHVNDDARLKTLQFLYYLQKDLGQTDWSVATEEGFDTPYNVEKNRNSAIPAGMKPILDHFPPIPYVRESRRAIGIMTLNAADIRRDGAKTFKNFPTALAVGNYPVDLHGCARESDLDCGDTSADISTDWTINPPVPGLFQVPFETFIPEVVDGFLVAEKNISVSRLVQAAIRLQPITMMTGQAAGALAAVAVQQGVHPREVQPLDVQWKLLEAGCQLSLHNLPDVPVTHPYWKHIQLALLYNIVGYGGETFNVNGSMRLYDLAGLMNNAFGITPSISAPDAPATRADFAVILAQAMGLDQAGVPSAQAFADIPATHPAYRSVQILDSLGVFAGMTGNPRRFMPDALLTRGEISFFTVTAALKAKKSNMHNVSLTQTDSRGPTGSVVINGGSAITNTTTVTLTIAASDADGAVSQLQVRKDGTDWFPWEPFASSRKVTLSEGDGVKSIQVRFRDASGNVSLIYGDTIVLDTSLPTGSVLIDNGAQTTTSTEVLLTLTATDTSGVTEMQFSKDGSNWFAWEPFTKQRKVTLVNGPGVNTIYVRFRDGTGNVSTTYSDSISLAP